MDLTQLLLSCRGWVRREVGWEGGRERGPEDCFGLGVGLRAGVEEGWWTEKLWK